MAEPPSKRIGIAVLDEMIARAEETCDRYEAEQLLRRRLHLQVRENRVTEHQAIEGILAVVRGGGGG